MLANQKQSALAAALIAIARSPETLDTASDKEGSLDAFLEAEAKGAYFCAYSRENSSITLSEANHIAEVMIEASRARQNPESLLMEEGIIHRSSAYHQAIETTDEILDRFSDEFEAANLTDDERDDLRSYLIDELQDKMIEGDTSTISDSWSSHDRGEVLFVFTSKEHLIDGALTSHRPWPEFSEMVVCEDLRHTLACLGYTVGEYRAASSNKHESTHLLRLARPAFTRPSPPLASFEKIQEAIDNACTTTFVFCLYAIVPLTDLAKIDPSQPMTFTKAHLASYSPWSGTFHDCTAIQNVTVTPAMGKLISPHGYYSPDEICGLVTSHYHSNLANPSASNALEQAA